MGKYRLNFVCAPIAALALALCLFGSPAFAESGVSVTVTPGSTWTSKVMVGVFPLTKAPQYAAWVETADGAYVGTVLVSASASRGKWKGSPKGGRPDALPVWFHAAGVDPALSRGKAADSTASYGVDAATSATPDAEATAAVSGSLQSLVPGTEYVVRFEINHSFDYNDAWPKSAKKGTPGYSGVNGQPSLVYEGRFVAGSNASVSLSLMGHGSLDGTDGSINRDLSGITSAREIVKAVIATVRGGN